MKVFLHKLYNLTSAVSHREREANSNAQWFLLAGILCACLPHVSFQPLSVIAISGVCLAWRIGFVLKLLPGMHRVAQLLVAAVALGTILHGENYNLGRDSGISLLVAALAIKQIQPQDEMNFYFSACLAYFVAAAVFLYDQSLLTFFLIGHAVVFVSLGLYANASIYQNHRNYRSVAQLLFYATPLTLLLFFLTPDFNGPLWEMPSDAYEAQTGLSNQMSPGKISALSDSNEVVFRVKFDTMPVNKKSFIDTLYWRGPVFGYFDGQTWMSLSQTLSTPWMQNAGFAGDVNEEQSYLMSASQWPESKAVAMANPSVQGGAYHITLEPHFNNWLFTLNTPNEVQEGFYLTSDDELQSRYVVNQPLQYSLKISSSPRGTPPDRRYLRMPNLYGHKTKLLVKKMQQELDPTRPYDTQFVTKVLEYFREEPFFYSKKPPLAKYDPVDEFVYKTKTGFCEHYASAFAFMMRAAGVPSRVVTGYLGGEYNTVGDYVIVRQSDAHAWTEVWLQNIGWVRVDPTAVLPPHRVDTSDASNPYVMAGFAGFDHAAFSRLGDWLDNLSYRWYGFLARVMLVRNQNWLSWIFSNKHYVLLSLLMMLSASLAWRLLNREPLSADPVVRAYEVFCQKLTRQGYSRLPYESANAYAHRVCAERPDWQTSVQAISRLYNQLRYGRNPNPIACKQLQREVARFRPAKDLNRLQPSKKTLVVVEA